MRLGRGVDLGQQPHRLRRQLDNLAGKHGKAELVGVAVGRAILMRVTISVTRAATLIRQRRIVSNWASRQNDLRGAKPRRVSINQYAAVWIKSRNWLAVALRHEVRSEARCSLCALIRFSVCPLAQ